MPHKRRSRTTRAAGKSPRQLKVIWEYVPDQHQEDVLERALLLLLSENLYPRTEEKLPREPRQLKLF